ncbi:MAG: substrate-binding domain-containing protein [Lachnospiraceae bacterium]|nr:substrate-binding domain-containing protein [Lachnospiraceae bacterium]
MEEAQRQFLERGITVTYEYMAPDSASADDQAQRLHAAETAGYDVIGVDVADESIISPILDSMVDSGTKVMTFSSSDAADGCKRIAYVGNTHNYEGGAALTEVLCEKLGYKGKVAVLVGSVGAPCHEDRAAGARDTIAKYPDLDGIICCNMSNPVGAARAILEKQSDTVIVGMDHDREALHYLKDGVIYCLGVQDCYSIGFDTLTTAVKIADGLLPGDLYPERVNEITTVIYQKDAAFMLELLYGDDTRKNFARGIGGDMSFTAGDVAETLYYVPIENTEWEMAVLISESVINEHIRSISEHSLASSRKQIIMTLSFVILFATVLLLEFRSMSKRRLEAEKETSRTFKNMAKTSTHLTARRREYRLGRCSSFTRLRDADAYRHRAPRDVRARGSDDVHAQKGAQGNGCAYQMMRSAVILRYQSPVVR